MKEIYFVRLQTQTFASYAENGDLIQTGNLIETPPPRKLTRIALVPSQDVLLTQTILPLTSARKLLQAAPYAIEDQLIDEVDELYFAVGEQEKNGMTPIAVVKKPTMVNWIEQLSTFPHSIKQVLPEALALPFTENQWQILLSQKFAIIRFGKSSGTAIEISQLHTMLKFLLAEEIAHPTQINITYDSENSDYDVTKLADLGVPIIFADQATTADAEFARGLAQHINKLNLLQSAYKLLQKPVNIHGLWRWVIYIAIGCGLLWLITHLAAILVIQHRDNILKKQIADLYYEIFPNATEVVSPKTRIEQRFLADKPGEGGVFLDTMLGLGTQLTKQNYAVVINSIDYRNDVLTIEVSAPDFQTLNKFSGGLAEQSYQVQQSNAHSENEGVKARFTIKS